MPSTRAERAERLDRLREEARIGAALRGVGAMLAAGRDVDQVLQGVTDAATRLTGADYGAFFRNGGGTDAGAAACIVATGSRAAFQAVPIPRREALFCSTFAGDGIVRIDDVTADPRFGHNQPYFGLPPGHPPIRSYLAVPVISPDGAIEGGLSLGAARAGVFARPAERYAVALAQQAVLALSNARHHAAERQARLAAEEAARRFAVLQRISVRLSDAQGLRAVAAAVVEAAAAGADADGTSVSLLDSGSGSLTVLAATGRDSRFLSDQARYTGVIGPAAAEALRLREPVLLSLGFEPECGSDPSGADTSASRAVVPLVVKGAGVGVLAFRWPSALPLDRSALELLTAIAQQAAQALERARLDEAEQRALQRLELLSDAGLVLSGSLDPSSTLGQLVRLLVPQVADLATIHLRTGNAVSLTAIAHVDPAQAAELQAAARTDPDPPKPDAPKPDLRPFLDAGRPLYQPDLSGAGTAPDALGWLGPAAGLAGVCSVIAVPFAARGRGLGVITVAMGPSGRHHKVADLALLDDLAGRTGASVDNALRYQRERDAALTLQRALLPFRMPQLELVTAAARYLPGAVGTTAGGDWYEVLDLSAGRVGLVIGDVMGRGIQAAAVMGQLRSALRAYATMDLPPAAVLTRMDAVVEEMSADSEGGQLVTCVYCIYEPASGRLTYASAGHPPPVLLTVGRRVSRLPSPSGVPLGVGGVAFEEHEVHLPAGSVLVLYSDGLVESRVRDVDTGVDQLCAYLRGAPADLEQLCEQALHLAGDPEVRHDDVALLAVRVQRPHPEDLLRLELPCQPVAVSEARASAGGRLRGWQLTAEQVDLGQLLVSEMVTNAIVACADSEPGSVQLTLRRGRSKLVVEVADGNPQLPQLPPRRAADPGTLGRGLFLVDLLASRWGARVGGTGKVVWCEVQL